jgi:hypothetical protein
MKRVIYLSEGRTVSLGAYVKAWQFALASPPRTMFDKGFNWYPETREQVLQEFRRGLQDRINRRVPGFPTTLRPRQIPSSRKWSYEWQIETYRAAQQLNHPRLIIDWLPAWLKPRYSNRLRENMID